MPTIANSNAATQAEILAIADTGLAATALQPGGALGTPSSGTLTNCTGLPVNGIVDDAASALGVGTLELGHASDTTLARASAGTVTVEGKTVATLSTAQVWTAQQNFQAVAITSSAGAIAWDLAVAQVAAHTATENTTLSAPSNIVPGGTYILLWTQHASAPKTLAFNAAYKFPGGVDPTVTATNGALDVFTFIGSADGTALLGVAQKAFA